MTNSIEQTADNLVRDEILIKVSRLVSDAMREGFGDENELINLHTGPIDYEEAVANRWGADKDEDESWLEETGYSEGDLFGLEPDAAREYCENFDVDLDDYQREVFEYWAVTPMMADSLESEGETVVRDWHGLNVWARTTTGQAISMDGVIHRIAENVHNV